MVNPLVEEAFRTGSVRYLADTAAMSTPDLHIDPVPEGYGTVTPWIISRDTAGLLDFVAAAFDATELARVPNEDGTIGHAEVRIGDSVVMMFDGRREWADTPAFLRLYVEDGEVTFRQALAAGAEVVTELTELFWGDRVGRVRDPFGNVWWIQERLAELTADEIVARATLPEMVEAMQYVAGAELVPPAASEAVTPPR
jgi:PhnB protein